MRVTAQFSEALRGQIDGMAIGDEFEVTCHARIVGADEALIDVTAMEDPDPRFVQGELEVRLLLSRAKVRPPSIPEPLAP